MVSVTTLKLACELAGVWMAGMAVILAFVVATVDRLNVRIVELEAKLEEERGAAGRGLRQES